MNDKTAFRLSACQRYIVCQIGTMPPHVLNIQEAIDVARQYRLAGAALEGSAQRLQFWTANALELVISESKGV